MLSTILDPRRFALAGLLAALVAALVAMVGCGDGTNECPQAFLLISSPSDGQVVGLEDDVAAGEEGIQIDVVARATGLATGTSVSLEITPEGGTPAAWPVAAQIDSSGNAVFEDVTVAAGSLVLRVQATACASGDQTVEVEDSVAITVVGDVGCELAFRSGTVDTDFFQVPVLNRSVDGDPDQAGYQGTVDISAPANYQVELLVLDVDQGSESSLGTVTTNGDGAANLDVTLSEGRRAVRAVCTSQTGGANAQSLTTTVQVDVTAPVCSLVDPAAGLTIIPDLDIDSAAEFVQVELRGSISGTGSGTSDVEGEPSTFTVGQQTVAGSAVANGQATGVGTFSSPGVVTVSFQGQDHAANPCAQPGSRDIPVELEGCAIAHLSPTGTVTTDGDGAAAGVQATVAVSVDAACVGQTATTDCDINGDSSVTVPAGGTTNIPVTLCAQAECDIDQITCTTRVTSAAGNTTQAVGTFDLDTQPPTVLFLITSPSVACGATITPDRDADPMAPGVQVRVRADVLGAISRQVLLSNGAVTDFALTLAANGSATATLEPGVNTFAASATDEHGLVGTAPLCNLTLADLAVTFDEPVASGLVGVNDGTLNGAALDLVVCGTVSDPSATVELSVTGGPLGLDTTVNPATGAWCTNAPVTLAESPPAHTLTAQATAGSNSGSAMVDLFVDLTPPDPAGNLGVSQVNRATAGLTWNAPADVVRYEVRFSVGTPFDDANFASTGSPITPPSPPGNPGDPEFVQRARLRQGANFPYFFAVASFDQAGNRSLATAGPLELGFDRSGLVSSPGNPPNVDPSDFQFFGSAIAGGDFNNDGFSDVLVGASSAPMFDPPDLPGGLVFLFMGTPGGINLTPDFVIEPTEPAFLGLSVTAADWNNDGIADVVIGDPFQNQGGGRVLIFFGGSTFDSTDGTPVQLSAGLASATTCGATGNQPCGVTIDTDNAGFFNSAGLGWSVRRARFNADARDDLIMGAPAAEGPNFTGSVVVLLGGSAARAITISDTTGVSGGAQAFVARFFGEALFAQFGYFTFNLGRLTPGGDDFAVSGDPAVAENDRIFVFRGREHTAGAGVLQELTFGVDDLSVVEGLNHQFGANVGSVEDLTGDGNRDIVITAHAQTPGRVYIIEGDLAGDALDVATLNPIVISGTGAGRGLANNNRVAGPDVDGDGLEDLVISAGPVSQQEGFVWYGGGAALAPGATVATSTADYRFRAQTGMARARYIEWVGDVNGDGLEDICWGDDESSENRSGEIEFLE